MLSTKPSKSSFRLERIVRKHVCELTPYQPTLRLGINVDETGDQLGTLIKLDANENVYDPAPEVINALQNLTNLNVYPDPDCRELRTLLSRWHGIPMDNILIGAGADEVIDLTLRCVLEDGDRVVICPPSFPMYAIHTAINNGKVIEVPRRDDFGLDAAKIKSAVKKWNPKILFIASPNTPDGSLVSEDVLKTVLKLPILVVLDEAYQPFSDSPSRMTRVLDHPNLVVLRTLSKHGALAGLRVGYGVFPSELISFMWRIKPPFSVNIAAQAAACATLTNLDHMEKVRKFIVQERGRMFGLLKTISFLEPLPSSSNFILCKVFDKGSDELKNELLSRGIVVRYYKSKPLDNHVRISIGKPEHTDALIAALKQIAEQAR